MIPFIDLRAQRQRLGSAIDEAVLRVVNHGQYIMGPEIDELEQQLSRFCGAEHVISCSSGTDALLLPLMAWKIGRGDAVFVPSFTFAATAEVVALLGATPVFVDVDADTFNMDVQSLKNALGVAEQHGLKPKAVIPVGLFGLPADFDKLVPVAREAGLKILDDAAQSFGGSYDGVPVGKWGDATATSFFPAKPLGCYGDGGAVFTDDAELAELMRSIRVHGQGADKYNNERIGLNARMDSIQAAVLIEKLKIFPDELTARRRVADRYNRGLQEAVAVPQVPAGSESAWAQYTIVSDERDGIRKRLASAGVPAVIYYEKPLHHQTAYSAFPVASGGNPTADWLSERVLSLPMHPYLANEEADRIVAAAMADGNSAAER